ncbi:unnamed protein product [Brassicogethes aeneus]|uniref:Kinesin-like protein n=1 Tax=Brassicogethes aeneus TaxID=1431903 RepID=A0A9P0BBH0_BRAAE|nr:unnamed protein product [Brassicogethes aeneus]
MNKESTVENVRVFVRVRPFNFLEGNSGLRQVVSVEENEAVLVTKPNTAKTYKKSYNFSKVFDISATQMDVYRTVAVPIVEKLFEGYNGTIFAYGQSGTGKTYTMIGDTLKDPQKGIIPNIFSHIFSEISVANNDMSYLVTVTYLEIYNEEVRDLLADDANKKLAIRERTDVGVYVKDLLGFTVDSMESVNDLLNRGNKNRAIGSTKLNALSSRSHAILTVAVESKNKSTNTAKFGKLNLVDLAGSERVSKSQATGERLREAGKINLSLSVLGNVISALVDQSTTHIPYRNSKLTRLLQDSLGGNSLTAMVAMVSASELDYDETINTLMYADRVKQVKNYLTVNVEKNSVIKQFEVKIHELEAQLNTLNNNSKEKRTRSKTKIHDEQLLDVEYQKRELLTKINMIQKKILVGGENLVEKAQTQLFLLENTEREIQSLDTNQKQLEDALFLKEVEKDLTQKKYTSLQEEDKELNRQIEEAEKLVAMETKNLISKENGYQHEIGILLYDNKCLAKQLQLVRLLKEHCVPECQLSKVLDNVYWDKRENEWRLKFVAHSGNNMRKKRTKSKSASDLSWNINKDAFQKYKKKIDKNRSLDKF